MHPVDITVVPYFEYDFVYRFFLGEGVDICNPKDTLQKKTQRTFLDMNGKPDKYMRLRHVVHLWNKRLIDNGIINLLRTEEDVRKFPNKEDYYERVKDIINENNDEPTNSAILHTDSRHGDIIHSYADISKAKKILNYIYQLFLQK